MALATFDSELYVTYPGTARYLYSWLKQFVDKLFCFRSLHWMPVRWLTSFHGHSNWTPVSSSRRNINNGICIFDEIFLWCFVYFVV